MTTKNSRKPIKEFLFEPNAARTRIFKGSSSSKLHDGKIIISALDSTNMAKITVPLSRGAAKWDDSFLPIEDDDNYDTFLDVNISDINYEKVYIDNMNKGELDTFRKVDSSFFKTEKARCLEKGILFEDLEFPANDTSLYTSQAEDFVPKVIEWKRPHEILKDPQFIVKDRTRFDVIQGQLGNCWLLAAMTVIADYKALFYRVVPPDQYFDKDYAGIFHFQFWHFGHWVDVVIDDRLPTVGGRLIYSQLPSSNAFWSVLLEKAYAKLHGCYSNLDGGHTAEGFQDFTGGLTDSFSLENIDINSFRNWLARGLNMGSLYGATIHPQNDEVTSSLMKKGLAPGHSYSVTALCISKEVNLIRLRDPWGGSKTWNGAWSSTSEEWMTLDPKTKNFMNPPNSREGEFWISMADLMTYFDKMEMCHLTADIYNEMALMASTEERFYTSGQNGWIEHHEHGEWNSEECTAGGRRIHDSHHLNPQYRTRITSLPYDNDNVTMIVALTQKNSRKMRIEPPQNVHIGFDIYDVRAELALCANFFKNDKNEVMTSTTEFIDTRETLLHMEVKPGEYVIVPCTHAANVNAKFLLRVYSDGDIETSKLNKKSQEPDILSV